MATKDFIAAIELSSSRVSGIAGRRAAEGSLEVLAYAGVDAGGAVHKGIVRNVEKAAKAIKDVVGQLERQLGSRIGRVYTGIGGQSVRTVENLISRQLPEEGVITHDLVDEISDENQQVPLADMDVLDVAPQEWRIDHHTHADPVGVVGKEVDATFLNVVARVELKRNLELAFKEAGLEIADLIVTPMATALAALQENEKLAGCALVDLGADTTTVAVYRAGLLRYLAVIPLGGNHITRDLTDLRLMEQEAEQLKCQYGNALYVEPTAEQPATCTTADGQAIVLDKFCDIVGARAEEILRNALHQISLSGDERRLLAGIVLTGGASALQGLEEAVRKLGKESTDKVKTVRTPQVKLTGHVDLLPTDVNTITLVGLMMRGHADCRRPDEVQTATPEVSASLGAGTIFGATGSTTTGAVGQKGTGAQLETATGHGTGGQALGSQAPSSSTGSRKQSSSSSQEPGSSKAAKGDSGQKGRKTLKGEQESIGRKISTFVGNLFGDDDPMTNQ